MRVEDACVFEVDLILWVKGAGGRPKYLNLTFPYSISFSDIVSEDFLPQIEH